MQNAAGSETSAPSCERHDGDHAIVSDLVSLIERVEESVRLIEAAIARETCFGSQEAAGNVVVLDDVTPRYVMANAALTSSQASLGAALYFLRDAGTVKHLAGKDGSGRRPLRSTGRG
jgi:hypothetical protein